MHAVLGRGEYACSVEERGVCMQCWGEGSMHAVLERGEYACSVGERGV